MSATLPPVIEYPASDGQPMAETGIHVQAIILLHQALQDFFADRPDVFIASDMFWYWVRGDTKTAIAPDVMVVPGVGNHHRRTFNSFDEGAVPAVVFEMASENTCKDDIGKKFWKYEELGVREYFLFDPLAEHLVPPLQGYRLNRSAYRRLLRDDDDLLESELGFRLQVEGTMLRLIDSQTGVPILTRAEQVEQAERKADDAIRKADEAERKADEVQRRVEQEKQRADALQAELDRLRAQLQPPPSGNGA